MTISRIFVLIATGAVCFSITSIGTANAHDHWRRDIELTKNNVFREVCSYDNDCLISETCRENKCVNACDHAECGLNEGCQLNYEHSFSCPCLSHYYRERTTGKCTLKTSCYFDEDCEPRMKCSEEKCVSGCLNHTCDSKEMCQTNNQHSFFCPCSPGYYKHNTTSECIPPYKWEQYSNALNNDKRLVHVGDGPMGPMVVVRLADNQGDLLPSGGLVRTSMQTDHLTLSWVMYSTTEVLLIDFGRFNWIPSPNGEIPHNAIVSGKLHTGEALYTCRIHDYNGYAVGMVEPTNGSCKYKTSGRITFAKSYDLLVHEI